MGVENNGIEADVVESSIINLERLDALMAVLEGLVHEDLRAVLKHMTDVEAFQDYLPIEIEQLSKEIYEFAEKWEPEDLNVQSVEETEDVPSAQEERRKVFLIRNKTPIFQSMDR